MDWQFITGTIAVLVLAGSILFHMFKTTWWMATLSANLESLKIAVDAIQKIIMKHEAMYYSKEDAARDFSIRDKQIEAAHRRLDGLKGKSDN